MKIKQQIRTSLFAEKINRNIDFQKRIKPKYISSDIHKALKSLQSRTDTQNLRTKVGRFVFGIKTYTLQKVKNNWVTQNYTSAYRDITPIIQKEISSEIKKMIIKKELPPSAENLIMKSPRCSQFYL